MTGPDRRTAALLAAALFVIFNSNGREIASADSQPTKYAARELLLRGTLGLNHVVGSVPELADRSGFVAARDGRYRSAYSPVPAIVAAAVSWPLWKAGLIDIRAPRAPNVIAVLSASLLSALSAALVYLTARRRLETRPALAVAIAFALGTGMWPTVSQTLWQHETAIFGLALAIHAFTRQSLRRRDALVIGLGLALAGSSRMQLAPAILVLTAAVAVRAGARSGACTAALVGAAAGVMMVINTRWFGTPFGAAPMLEALHETVHRQSYSFAPSLEGLAGLLVSPSRGLLIYSPVVLTAAAGMRAVGKESWSAPLRWCLAAALVQYVFYGSYSVWWGGHTFGPRYMLDILPLLAPLGAGGVARMRGPAAKGLAVAAMAWSILVAATGAFGYPHDRWNTDPVSVDRFHERLWDWSDPQIVRCWQRGASPQNFNLLSPAAFRVPRPSRSAGPAVAAGDSG